MTARIPQATIPLPPPALFTCRITQFVPTGPVQHEAYPRGEGANQTAIIRAFRYSSPAVFDWVLVSV